MQMQIQSPPRDAHGVGFMCPLYTLNIHLLDSLFCRKATAVAAVHRTVVKSRHFESNKKW